MAATMEQFRRILKLCRSSQKMIKYMEINGYRPNLIRNRLFLVKKNFIRKKPSPSAVLLSLTTVRAFGLLEKKRDVAETKETKLDEEKLTQKLIQEADAFYDKNEIENLYNLLRRHAEEENDEILWRLARACHDMSKQCENKDMKRDYMFEGFKHIKRALKTGDRNFAVHKWYAIFLDKTAELEGTKQRISNAYLVKEHFLKTIELNPKDATSIYCLGHWCFAFADMPWYTKKIASAIFATPPSSTYEEALKYLEMAEKVDPDFYSMNHLLLGKTYLRLGNREAARVYLRKARDYPRPLQTPDDKQAYKEAVQLLKDYKLESNGEGH